MNLAKVAGAGIFVAAKLTNQDWIEILGIVIMVLGMIQAYLKNRSSS